jgi:hypothetical protein
MVESSQNRFGYPLPNGRMTMRPYSLYYDLNPISEFVVGPS